MKMICPDKLCENWGDSNCCDAGIAHEHDKYCCPGGALCMPCVPYSIRQHYRDVAAALVKKMAKECHMSKVDAVRMIGSALHADIVHPIIMRGLGKVV